MLVVSGVATMLQCDRLGLDRRLMVDVMRIAQITPVGVDLSFTVRWCEDRAVVIGVLIHRFRSAQSLTDASTEAIDGPDQLGEQLLAVDLVRSQIGPENATAHMVLEHKQPRLTGGGDDG